MDNPLQVDLINIEKDVRDFFLTCLKNKNFPIKTTDFDKLKDDILSIDPRKYAYDSQKPDRYFNQVKNVLLDNKVSLDDSDNFVKCIDAMRDPFDDIIASLAGTAIPIPIKDIPDDPIIKEYSNGDELSLWIIDIDDEYDSLRNFYKKIEKQRGAIQFGPVLIPIYVAAIVMTVLALAATGEKRDFFKSIEEGIKKVNKDIKRFFKRLF